MAISTICYSYTGIQPFFRSLLPTPCCFHVCIHWVLNQLKATQPLGDGHCLIWQSGFSTAAPIIDIHTLTQTRRQRECSLLENSEPHRTSTDTKPNTLIFSDAYCTSPHRTLILVELQRTSLPANFKVWPVFRLLRIGQCTLLQRDTTIVPLGAACKTSLCIPSPPY